MNPLERLNATITKPFARRKVLKDLEKFYDEKLRELGGGLTDLELELSSDGPLKTRSKVNLLTGELRRSGELKRIIHEMKRLDLALPQVTLSLETILYNIEEMTRGINHIYELIAKDQNLTFSSVIRDRLKVMINSLDVIEDWRENRRIFFFSP